MLQEEEGVARRSNRSLPLAMSSQIFRVIASTPAVPQSLGIASKRDERATSAVQTSVATLTKSVEALERVLKDTTEELGHAKREVRLLADAQGESMTTVSVEIKSLVNRAQKSLLDAIGTPAPLAAVQELADLARKHDQHQMAMSVEIVALRRGMQEQSTALGAKVDLVTGQIQHFETKASRIKILVSTKLISLSA